MNNVATKNPVRSRKNTAEGGCGGNSAVFLQKIEAKSAALLVQSRTQQKSFLFLLEEKIGRAQIKKSEENFFAGWRVVASGGGLASLVWFRSRVSDKMSSSQTVKTHTINPPAYAGVFIVLGNRTGRGRETLVSRGGKIKT